MKAAFLALSAALSCAAVASDGIVIDHGGKHVGSANNGIVIDHQGKHSGWVNDKIVIDHEGKHSGNVQP
jgi:hypothetical protein